MDSEHYPTKEELMSTIFKLVHKIDIKRTFCNAKTIQKINKKESINQYPLWT